MISIELLTISIDTGYNHHMSFSTDPTNFEFSTPPNVCNACFDAGKTPKQVIVSVAGIGIGNNWAPGDPPPPFGDYIIEVDAPCEWSKTIDGYVIEYNNVGALAEVLIHDGAGTNYFWSWLPAACITFFNNFVQNPAGVKYFGGAVNVIDPLGDGPFNLSAALALFNIDPAVRTFAAFKPIDADSTVIRFTRRIGRDNIAIKLDTS